MKNCARALTTLMQRFTRAPALHRTPAAFAARLDCRRRRVTLRGSDHSFTLAEIREIDRRIAELAKIAQSDVPDNMLGLLTALSASAARS